MRATISSFIKFFGYALFGALLCNQARADAPTQMERMPLESIDAGVKTFASILQTNCPIAAPDSQPAFDACRNFLFNDENSKRMLSRPVILWGRQKDAKTPLKDTNLTQFSPDIWAGLYLPLFMFTGKYTVNYDEKQNLYLARLGASFRNRLQPGQFPYPFWHEANKWAIYESAKTVLLWIDPRSGLVKAAQFSVEGDTAGEPPRESATPPAFDGKWVWTDGQGKTQPAVTLFDGLYRDNNPYKPELDKTYRSFAIALRESQCLSCHVPDNPNHMKRLVLLQSPAHASGEIQRVLKSVRDKKMPLDDFGVEKDLDPQMMKVLLDKGGEFEKAVLAARQWEQQQARPH